MIKRLQVADGFLDGLDVEFEPGLNVIIGPRGTGKTSVLELLRFGLGVDPLTAAGREASGRHIAAVLAGGKVTVTVQQNDHEIVFQRSSDASEPQGDTDLGSYETPMMLAHDEVEALASDAHGRLRLIDSFRPSRARLDVDEQSLLLEVGSLTTELLKATDELERLEERLSTRPDLERELEEAVQREAELVTQSSGTDLQTRLTVVNDELSRLAVHRSELERGLKAAQDWAATIRAAVDRSPVVTNSLDQEGDPILNDLQTEVDSAERAIRSALDSLDARMQAGRNELSAVQARHEERSDAARELRQQLEAIQAGAGEATRRTAALRTELAQLASLEKLKTGRAAGSSELRQRRSGLLDQLDAMRNARSEQREAIVSRLNELLGPRIRVELERRGVNVPFADAIVSGLKGSGLHAASVAQRLSESLSPREFVEAIEKRDAQFLSSKAEIPTDRADRVIEYLLRGGFEAILTCPVTDLIVLKLLTGDNYRESDHLSTGQRCTVVLPILLAREGRVLTVDQPEDNLDNAFVVDTLVRSLLARRSGQRIFTTHNPNIPVLGNADLVVSLRSDGHRGFAHACGSVDDDSIVDAITSVMEGGREAFERRAEFYGSHQ